MSANNLSVTMLIIVASRVDPILPVRLKSQVCIIMYTSWFNRWDHVKLYDLVPNKRYRTLLSKPITVHNKPM